MEWKHMNTLRCLLLHACAVHLGAIFPQGTLNASAN